jgi:hypothetical protein
MNGAYAGKLGQAMHSSPFETECRGQSAGNAMNPYHSFVSGFAELMAAAWRNSPAPCVRAGCAGSDDFFTAPG